MQHGICTDIVIDNPSSTTFFIICEIIRCLILNFHEFQIYFIDILAEYDQMNNIEIHTRRSILNAIKHSPACNKRILKIYIVFSYYFVITSL